MSTRLHNTHCYAHFGLANRELAGVGGETGWGRHLTPPDQPPHNFLLIVEIPATGYTKVLSFETRFDRALQMLALSAQPVVLHTRDCE